MKENTCNPSMYRIKTIHFIGIGGSGMNGIAEVLLNQGYQITGSDKNENVAVQRLRKLGAKIFLEHKAENVSGADAIVVSSAISQNNPEIVAAHNARIPIIPRAEMLAELMRFHHGIAISGTHGKTTTTSLIASVLGEGGLDPTFVIGGLLNSSGTNAKLGTSKYFVAEADESDASFLLLHPTLSVVTNIDADHMGTYNNDFDKLRQVFVNFLHQLPFYGLAVLCIDDPVVKEIAPKIGRSTITYGFCDEADVQAFDFKQTGFSSTFKVWHKYYNITFDIKLNLPGKHNALNALAAIAVAKECKVTDKAICGALTKFKGVGRRLEIHGEMILPNKGKVLVIDDYGHHPRELQVTIEAVRAAWPDKRLALAFQPHRYSRTQALFDDFTAILSEVDVLFLLEIYSAGEKPISGISGRALARSIRQRGKIDPIFVKNINELQEIMKDVLCDGDVLLLQGAGDIGKVASKIVEKL